MDKRRVLCAAPPYRINQMVQVELTRELAERLYYFAFDNHLSRSAALRKLIEKGTNETAFPPTTPDRE